jgi:hypothetical protein
MTVTEPGMCTETREEQSLNPHAEMVTTDGGMRASSRLLQYAKVPRWIVLTELGMATEINELQL